MSKTFGDEQEEEEDKEKIDGLSDDNRRAIVDCNFR